jgi:hypothetical protein
MMSKFNSWADTLKIFLESSNEDEQVVAIFKDKILPEIQNTCKSNTVKWLEIGIGDGNKTKQVSDAISQLTTVRKIDLTVCEPSIEWLIALQQSGFSRQLNPKIQLHFINRCVQNLMNTNEVSNYDFISMVQVMYSESIKEVLLKYIDEKSKSTPCLIWVDVEDSSSDLYKIRQLLIKQGKKVVHALANQLMQNLTDRKIAYQTFLTTDKTCHIDKADILENDSHWLFPFILGCSIVEFEHMHLSDKQKVKTVVREYVAQLPTNMLNITDISILIYT